MDSEIRHRHARPNLRSAAIRRGPPRADQEKKPEEQKGPKAASVEVTPKTGNAQLGDQLQFKAVAKDAAGNVLDMKPTVWFAAPFDAATADVNGLVDFTSPGEITVGAVFGEQVGFAKVMVRAIRWRVLKSPRRRVRSPWAARSRFRSLPIPPTEFRSPMRTIPGNR